MKTYLLDTINRIKRYSESLDVQTALCNTPWKVFNDTGEKEVFIFNTDGTVLITVNGIGIKRTWQWISANKSLIINQPDDTIVMLHPEYFNNSVLALNRDGTQEYAFLIDDNKSEAFAPKSLTELKNYFLAIEQRAIEAELAERQRLQEEEIQKQEEALRQNVRKKFENTNFGMAILIFLAMVLLACLFIVSAIYLMNIDVRAGIIIMLAGAFIPFYISIIIFAKLPICKAKKFIKDNPNDELVPYIKQVYGLD